MNGFALTDTWRGCSGTRHRGALAAIAILSFFAVFVPGASAAGPPIVGAQWSSAVGSDAAKLSAQLDPNGLNTTYHFEYTSSTDFTNCGTGANPACHKAPAADATILASGGAVSVPPVGLSGLVANTTYRYRIVAQNSDPGSPSTGPTKTFTTKGSGPVLLDSRGWEMVSPIQKNGGQVDPPGTIAGGGVLQAASQGGSVTYGSTASFSGGEGSPPASQYLAARNSSGWDTQNITAPIFSGSYDLYDQGAPYQLFSSDLASALLLNGDHCRSGASGCAVANPPLAGSNAPAGYQDYYRRDNGNGAFSALLGSSDAAALDIAPADFDLRLAGASPDLAHVVLSTCAALTPGANEVASGSGCDSNQQNLYEWSQASGPTLLNGATPGASLGAQSGAVSSSGDRVYFTQGGNLYLREVGAAQTKQADADAGGGGTFETASTTGSIAFFSKGGHLWRYDSVSDSATDLTPSGGVVGVLGAAANGSHLYYLTGTGLYLCASADVAADCEAAATKAADSADSSDYPPATGAARVSADGTKLLFLSTAQLTGYDNTDLATGDPDSEVFLYMAGSGLACLSCNPTNERPLGPSSIPGAIPNGTAPLSTNTYKPRVLSADGKRVFFDSADTLALTDTNSNHLTGGGITDAYEWEASGEGSCAKAGGCLSLVSSGRSAGGALFVDASADGSDAFFITDDSLIAADPGSLDLYDARVNGGFSIPSPPLACEGDACQSLPSPPGDPTLTTLLPGAGNPPVNYHNLGGKKKKAKRCKKGFQKKKVHGKFKCVKKKHKRHGKRAHRRHAKRHHKRGGRR